MDKRDTDHLCGLIADHEEWLLDRIVDHAKDRGYMQYTASLREAWRLAVAGLSGALIDGLQSLYPDYELKGREDYTKDPVAAFAVVACQRHRARGVSVDMFLGLLKYFREGYLDLVREHGASLGSEGQPFTAIQRLFDRMEIVLTVERVKSNQSDLTDELQTRNQAIVDEKCRYLSILESLSVPVFILDENGGVENLNLAAQTMLRENYRPGEGYDRIVGGKPCQIPEDVEAADRGVSQRVEFASLFSWLREDLSRFAGGSDTAARFERSAEGPNGTRRFDVTLSRIPDVSETLTGVIVALEDVTQKKEDAERLQRAKEIAEAAVARSKEVEQQLAAEVEELAHSNASLVRLRTAVEQSPDGIATADLDGHIQFVNAAWAEAHGFEADELLGKHLSIFHTDEQMERDVVPLNTIVMETGSHQGEVGHVRKDGAEFLTWMSMSVLRDEADMPVGLVASARDITEQKRAELAFREREERLRDIAERISDWIWEVDASGRFTYCSESVENILGYQAEDLLGKTPFDFMPPEDVERGRSDFAGGAHTKGPFRDLEHVHVAKDGRRIHLLTSGVPILGNDGELLGFRGVGCDITQRKRAEAELAAANAQLVEASRQAGMAEVATSVLHNIGNVLNSVNVSASIVADTVRKSRARSLTRVVEMLGEHSEDLGTFISKDERGKHLPRFLAALAETLTGEQAIVIEEVESLSANIERIKAIVSMQQSYANASGLVESVSLVDLLEDAVRLNTSSNHADTLQVERDYAESPLIEIDRHKLLQILINLIRNARHAMVERGEDDRRLTLRTTANGDDRVRIEVIDNGVGIPGENLTRIFAHGFTTKQAKGGRGFGLHHSALLAREMGGSLTAHSDGPGTGAAFTLELPLRQAKVNRGITQVMAAAGGVS